MLRSSNKYPPHPQTINNYQSFIPVNSSLSSRCRVPPTLISTAVGRHLLIERVYLEGCENSLLDYSSSCYLASVQDMGA